MFGICCDDNQCVCLYVAQVRSRWTLCCSPQGRCTGCSSGLSGPGTVCRGHSGWEQWCRTPSGQVGSGTPDSARPHKERGCALDHDTVPAAQQIGGQLPGHFNLLLVPFQGCNEMAEKKKYILK